MSLRLWHLMPSHVIEHCSLLPSLDRKPSEKLFKKGRSIKNRTDNLAAMAVFEEENLKKYLPALRKVVQESTALHPAWICLLTLLLPGIDLSWLNDFSPSVRYLGPSRISPEVTELNFFWNLLIEDGVFNAKSMERLSQGFLIADKIVKCVDTRFLKFLLTPNFLRALSKHSSRRDSFLYSISSQFIETCANLMQDMDSATKAMMANAFRKYSISGLKDPLGAQPMHLTEERQDPEISVRIRKLQKEIESAFESLDDEKIDRQESIIGLLVEEARNLSLSPNLVAEILTFLAGQIIYKASEGH